MKAQTILFAALCTSTAVANAIELTDFTDPNTKYDDAFVNFNASAQSGNQNQVSYSAILGGNYEMRNSTEKRVIGLNVDGRLNASRDGTVVTPEEALAADIEPSGDSKDDFEINVRGSRDAYFSETREKLFYFTQGNIGYRDDAEDEDISATLGLGYGRVWTSTALARSLRLQEELMEKGIVSGEMSDDALIELSTIIAKEEEYKSIHGDDDFRGVWYSDMEQVIVGSGMLVGDSLSAMATVDLDQVLRNERISVRKHGWLVRGGVGIQFSDYSGASDADPKLLIEAEYAKPYGLKGQLINTTSYEPVFGDNAVQRLNNRLSYTYEVSDTVDWINTWDLGFTSVDDEDFESVTNTLSSNLALELSDSLDLVAGVTVTDIDDDTLVDEENNLLFPETGITTTLSLRYRVK